MLMAQGVHIPNEIDRDIHCKDCFAADVGHVHCRGLVVGSRSRVSGSDKGGEGRGQLSAMRRERGR